MQTLEELTREFAENADRAAEILIEEYGLKHKRTVDGLHSPLLRWLDFRLRIIDPRPRQIFLSDRFPKTLESRTGEALQALHEAIAVGADVNPFQGKGLKRSDSSGKNRNERTDLLWADWGIHHLHVAEKPVDGEDFSARGDYLLFAVFYQDIALFIDVQPHSTRPEDGDPLRFAREDLVRVIARNWPAAMEPFQLRGMVHPEREISDESRKLLRRSGIEAPLVVDGKAYFAPGHGVTSASTPGKVTDAITRLRGNLSLLAQEVFTADGQFKAALPGNSVADSHFSLVMTLQGLTVFERTTDRGWALPDAKFDESDTFRSRISDALSPPWVKRALQEAANKA